MPTFNINIFIDSSMLEEDGFDDLFDFDTYDDGTEVGSVVTIEGEDGEEYDLLVTEVFEDINGDVYYEGYELEYLDDDDIIEVEEVEEDDDEDA